MPLQAPNLDDRRYADLLAEARTRIPRYTPEWTDFNESDPGITMLELFAWMTDILLYRVNQVPEVNYIKFLQLLGIELKPAQPARADLTFKLAANGLQTDFVAIPGGTQVAGAGTTPSGGPVIFETDSAIFALKASMKSVQSFDGFSHSVETTKNSQPGQWFYPFGPKARAGSALLFGFDAPLPQQQINLMFYIFTGKLMPEGQHCDLSVITLPTQATLAWEYWSLDLQRWVPLILNRDETRSLMRNGQVYFRGPGAALKPDSIGQVPAKLYWIRVRLVASSYEVPPRLEMVLTNTISSQQLVTVQNEVLGVSNGLASQIFQLAQTPVYQLATPLLLPGVDGLQITITSLRLEVDEGSGPLLWQQVDDFYSSTADDPHYTLDRTTGVITFGDGVHGRIPLVAVAQAGIIAREYRYGGGKEGNAPANTITQLESSIEGFDSVTNLHPSFGGADEETVTDAKGRAPQALKSKDRAVTAEDFEYIATQTPGARIRRAKALPLTHPRFPDQPIPGVVTVIVVPDTDSPNNEMPNPSPSAATLAVVCAYLSQRRLLTSEVYIIPPIYHLVQIQTNVVASPEADLAVVQKAVVDNLTNYFHPLTGGKDGQGWPFGQSIFYSSVFRVVLDTDGVDHIQDLIIFLDNERQPLCQDVPIGAGHLLYSNGHTIDVAYSFGN